MVFMSILRSVENNVGEYICLFLYIYAYNVCICDSVVVLFNSSTYIQNQVFV